MQKVFDEVNSLDKRCYEQYGLSEDILMEHAALSMINFIESNFVVHSKVLIACGVGNNGADGITLARLLHKKYDTTLYIPTTVKSDMAKLQLKRVKLIEVPTKETLKENENYDVVVDCLFGSGLNKPLSEEYSKIINFLNKIKGYKIACDIPSGIDTNGKISTTCFKADTTITMGALKKQLFLDNVKDYVGDIIVANLGVQRELYEKSSNCFLLEKDDFKAPYRTKISTHKGNFGHTAVIVGEKKGAGILCAQSSFTFGSGLVSCISRKEIENLPFSLMSNYQLPSNTTAIAIGMGLGNSYDKTLLQNDIPKVCDADMFYQKEIVEIINQKNIILTPHPKEFCSLLKLCDIANINIQTLQENRFLYVEKFCKKYPDVVLLLKGSNVLIGQNDKIYINPLGTSKLSFGGSGDVLSGLIVSLLAQKYSPIEATINGSLAHTIAASNYTYSNYSLTPESLIDEIKKL